MILERLKLGTNVIPYFHVILTGQFISCIIFMIQGHPNGQKVKLSGSSKQNYYF